MLLSRNEQFDLAPLLTKLLETKTAPPSLKLSALKLFLQHNPESSFPQLLQAIEADSLTYRQGAVNLLSSHPDLRLSLIHI